MVVDSFEVKMVVMVLLCSLINNGVFSIQDLIIVSMFSKPSMIITSLVAYLMIVCVPCIPSAYRKCLL